MRFLPLLLLLSVTSALASPFWLSEEELNPESEEVLIKKPEKYLRNESMIYNLNTDLGIKDQRRYTGEDRNKFSIAGHILGDYEHVDNLLGFELNYMRRSTRYHQLWYGLQFFQHRTVFEAITQNKRERTGDDANADSKFQRPDDAKSNILAGGFGVGYRFKLLLDILDTEDTFESIDVFANYVRLDESFIDKTYNGYGLTTSYGIHKRARTSFFYGGKLSYNLAMVTREKLGNESHSDRTFSLGWLSLALEMGFFF